MNMGEKINSHYDIKATETNRGFERYLVFLGITEEELITLTKDKVVMDLGSGQGTYGAEMSLWEQIGHPAPIRVDSVNLKYSAPDYDDLATQVRDDYGDNLALPKTFDGVVSDEQVEQAWNDSRKNHLGLDWNNLSSIEDNSYDVIFSVFAFPYYSDLQTKDISNDKQRDRLIAEGNLFDFGPESQKVFSSLARILKKNGTILLETQISKTYWDSSPKLQKELRDLLEPYGCKLDTIVKKINIGENIVFKITKPTFLNELRKQFTRKIFSQREKN
jgi:SAM-dependent methyltransferase